MKKIALILAGFLVFSLPAELSAQDSDKPGNKVGRTIKKGARGVKKGAKKAAHQTAELGSRTKAKVADQKLEGRYGPNGETVYIDGVDRYYWIDDKGRHIYISGDKLRK